MINAALVNFSGQLNRHQLFLKVLELT